LRTGRGAGSCDAAWPGELNIDFSITYANFCAPRVMCGATLVSNFFTNGEFVPACSICTGR